MTTRTLVVWCPDWPITAAGLDPDTPAAVLHGNRVVVCSAAARAEGVRRGLRRREAQARCAALVVLDADPARDARVFEPVVAAIEALAPKVEVLRPGLCAVASRGPSRYFGGDDALVEHVAIAVGHNSSAGVADGRFGATLAARRGRVVPPGGSRAFLAPLPVTVLDRPDLADLLLRLGIRTLGELAALPPADVLARFGSDGAVAHRLAAGLDERPLGGRPLPPELVVTVELDPPADRVDAAAFAARGMADDLLDRLARHGLVCIRLGIEAETEHGEVLARLWRAVDGFSPSMVVERLRWQLDGWLTGTAEAQPTGALTILRLAPDEVVPDVGRQLGFWGGDAEADRRAARAVARVQGLLGFDAVVAAVPTSGRGPGEQVQLLAWGDTAAGHGTRQPVGSSRADGRPPWPGRVPSPSPATVFPAPPPAAVTDQAGTPVRVTGRGVISAAPAHLSIAGRPPLAVTAWAGPWPADERWWDPDAHHRHARLQVLTADASAWLLAIEGGRWRVEGSYD